MNWFQLWIRKINTDKRHYSLKKKNRPFQNGVLRSKNLVWFLKLKWINISQKQMHWNYCACLVTNVHAHFQSVSHFWQDWHETRITKEAIEMIPSNLWCLVKYLWAWYELKMTWMILVRPEGEQRCFMFIISAISSMVGHLYYWTHGSLSKKEELMLIVPEWQEAVVKKGRLCLCVSSRN